MAHVGFRRGWYGDSYRHYLASKGIASGRRGAYLAAKGVRTRYEAHKYFMPFVKETGVPVVDYPGEYKSYVEKKVVKLPPRRFWEILKETSPNYDQVKGQSLEQWRKGVSGGSPDSSEVKRAIAGFREGKNVPAPYIGLEVKDGRVVREGFDNAYAATVGEELGLDEMPMVFLKAREYRPAAKGKVWGEFVFTESELAKERELIEQQGSLTVDHPAPGVNVIRPVNGESYKDSDWREVTEIDTVPDEFNKKPGSKWHWEDGQ